MKKIKMSVQVLTSILKDDADDFKAGLLGFDPSPILQDLYTIQLNGHAVVEVEYNKDGDITALNPVLGATDDASPATPV